MENEDKIDEKKFNLLEKFKKKSGEVSKEDDEKVLEETEKQKKEAEEKNNIKKLKKKYGVMKEIPQQELKDDEKLDGLEKIETTEKEEIGSLTDLTLKTEKLEGKLEIIAGYKEELNERLTQISEEIGELRSMVMEGDRSFGKIETDFEEIKAVVGDVEPLNIKKSFEKKEQEIMENTVRIEKNENLVKALEKEAENFRKTMEKIKSFDNLVDIYKKMNEKINSIDDMKKYTDRTSAKIESIFSEVNDKVNELQNQKEKIMKLDELTTEITQMLDEISIKINDFAQIKDFKKFQEEIGGEIKKLSESKDKIEEVGRLLKETKIDDKLLDIEETKKIINNLIPKINDITKKLNENTKSSEEDKKSIKDVIELEKRVSQIDKFSAIPPKIEKIKQIIEKQNFVISDLINSIERVKSIPDINIKELKNLDLSLRFYQLLNIIPFLKDEVKLKEHSTEIKQIIKYMKESGSWNSQKENFMNDLVKTSKRMINSGNQDEILDKIGKLSNWISDITDEIKGGREIENKLEKDVENIKKSLEDKIGPTDVEDVFIIERNMIELTGKFSKLKSIIERQNSVVNDVVEKMKEVESKKIDEDIINKIKLSNRFYQILSIFPYIADQEKLKIYSIELNQTIENMKILGVWDKEKEEFMKNMIETNKRSNQTEQERDEKINEIKTKLIKFIDKSDFREFQKIVSDEIKRLNETLRDKASVNDMDNLLLVDKNVFDITKKVEKLKSVVEKQNFVINNLITRLEEREVDGIDKKSVKDLQASVRFYQLMNILPYIIEPTRIKSYLMELKDIVQELKNNKQWNDEKEMFMKNFLSSLSDSYKSRGYEEIGAAYAEIS